MFSTENVSGGGELKYIGYGIHEVDIISMEASEDAKSFVLTMKLRGGDETDATKFKFNITSDNGEDKAKKALDYSMIKLRHIQTKLMSDAQADSLTGQSLAEFVSKNNAALAGKYLRMKFSGKQYLNAANEPKWKAEIPLPYGGDFAEPMVDNGQSTPAVPNKADTKLVFDTNNQYDYQKLAHIPDADGGKDADAAW